MLVRPLNDEVLLERFSKGKSEEAFALLVDRYATFVYGTCLRKLKHPDLAEDAAQSVFLLLSKNSHRLHAERTLAPWLYSMCVVVCRGALRQEGKWKRSEIALQKMKETHDRNDLTLSVVLDAALAKLARKDREAILLHYLQGFSFLELAKILKTSPDSARMRVNRALQQLRNRLVALGVSSAGDELPRSLSSLTTQVPASALTKFHAASVRPLASNLVKGASKPMLFRTPQIFLSTALVAGFFFARYINESKPSYHVASYAVQPAGADRDPKFPVHLVGEQWVSPATQRITNYPYWKIGQADSAFLLEGSGDAEAITVRNTRGKILTITRKQAIEGTVGGKWAQAGQITPIDSDFSKIEHFWKRAVVTRLPAVSIASSGKTYVATPVQVTVSGMFRMTGYLDTKTGRLVRQETYSKDEKGWYLVGYEEFDYSPFPSNVFDKSTLTQTPQFELALPAKG